VEATNKFQNRTNVVVNHTLLPDDPQDRRKHKLIDQHGDGLKKTRATYRERHFHLCAKLFHYVDLYLDLKDIPPTYPYLPPQKDTVLSIARFERTLRHRRLWGDFVKRVTGDCGDVMLWQGRNYDLYKIQTN